VRRSRGTPRGRTKQFTLVEVLVASVLASGALLGTVGMLLQAYGTLDRSGEHTAAAQLGQQRIEWLRNRPFAGSDLAAGTVTETLSGTYAGYTRITTIVDNTPRAGVKRVSVRTTTPAGLVVDMTSLVAQ